MTKLAKKDQRIRNGFGSARFERHVVDEAVTAHQSEACACRHVGVPVNLVHLTEIASTQSRRGGQRWSESERQSVREKGGWERERERDFNQTVRSGHTSISVNSDCSISRTRSTSANALCKDRRTSTSTDSMNTSSKAVTSTEVFICLAYTWRKRNAMSCSSTTVLNLESRCLASLLAEFASISAAGQQAYHNKHITTVKLHFLDDVHTATFIHWLNLLCLRIRNLNTKLVFQFNDRLKRCMRQARMVVELVHLDSIQESRPRSFAKCAVDVNLSWAILLCRFSACSARSSTSCL